MKKSIVFFAFLAALVIGIWLLLAENFEKIAKDEILPKVEKYSEIVQIDSDSIEVDKYKFSIFLGKMTVFPDNKEFSISMDNAKVYYNPITDKLVLCFCGDKATFTINGKEFYSSNPNDYIDFSRALLKKDFSDFSVVIGLGETDLYMVDTDKKILSMHDGKIDISFSKDDGMVNPKLKVEFEDLEVGTELSTAIGGFSLYDLAKSGNDTQKLQDKIFDGEVKQLLEEFNKLAGKSQYEFSFNSHMTEELANSIANFLVEEPSFKLLADFLDSKRFDIKMREQFARGGIKSDFKLKIKKDEEDLDGNMSIDAEMDISDEMRQVIASLTAAIYSNIITDIAKIKGLESSDFMKFSKQLVDTKGYNMDFNFGYNIKKEESKHELIIAGEKYKFSAKGSAVGSVVNENIQFDEFGNWLVNTSSAIADQLTIVLNKAELNEGQKSFVSFAQKIAEHIKSNSFETFKVFHKGDLEKLTKEGKFESDIEINTDLMNFSFDINGRPSAELLSDPKVTEFMSNLPKL